MVEEGALLVDVREIDEYQQVRIPGSSFMPLSSLSEQFEELPTDIPVILYCRTGSRSAHAVTALTYHASFTNVVNMEGGIVEWYEEGLPVAIEHVDIPVDQRPFSEMEPELAAKDLANGEIRWVVDVRPSAQFGTGHVPGATNIPFRQLPLRYAELPKAETVLVACDRGEISTIAARLLADLDFNDVRIIDGGIEAWRYRDLPLVEFG